MKPSNNPYPYNLLHDVFINSPIKEYPTDIIGSVEYAISLISVRERDALKMRYQEMLTLREIGERLEVTHERARQIVNKSLFRLRHPNLNKYLKYGVQGVIKNSSDEAVNNAAKMYVFRDKYSRGTYEKDMTLRDLTLSTRAYNCLFRANCRTATDIINLGYKKLVGLRCMGKKTYNEIVDKLERCGYDCTDIKG